MTTQNKQGREGTEQRHARDTTRTSETGGVLLRMWSPWATPQGSQGAYAERRMATLVWHLPSASVLCVGCVVSGL